MMVISGTIKVWCVCWWYVCIWFICLCYMYRSTRQFQSLS